MNLDHTYDEDGDIWKTEKIPSLKRFVEFMNLLEEMQVGSPQYDAMMDQIIEEEERK